MEVKKFIFDKWVQVEESELVAGDIVIINNKTLVVQGPLFYEEGKAKLPAEAYPSEPPRLLFGAKDKEYICMAMDYCGSSAQEFDDDTMMIIDIDDGRSLIFSPRLSVAYLNNFCKDNMEKYIEHFDKNINELERGWVVPIKHFWL